MNKFYLTSTISVFLLLCANGIFGQANSKAEMLMDALKSKDSTNSITLALGVDSVNYCNVVGTSLLMGASLRGYTEVCRILIDKGANIDYQDSARGTALMNASLFGHAETVKLLLDKGAKMDYQGTKEKVTALMLASRHGETETVKLLLDKGAKLDLQNIHGKTALIIATEFNYSEGHSEVVRLLLDKGASRVITDNDGKTALDYEHNNDIEALPSGLDKNVFKFSSNNCQYVTGDALYGRRNRNIHESVDIELDLSQNLLTVLIYNGPERKYYRFNINKFELVKYDINITNSQGAPLETDYYQIDVSQGDLPRMPGIIYVRYYRGMPFNIMSFSDSNDGAALFQVTYDGKNRLKF